MILIDWEDVQQEISGSKNNNVLLGNGFSISYCHSSFAQKEILQKMPSLNGIANVKDIEECIKATQSKIKDTLNDSTVPKNIIEMWIKEHLHKEFMEALYELAPKSLNNIDDYSEDKIKLYRNFFNNFDSIYTLNYDPILYWLCLRFINYGEEDFVEYLNLKESLEHYTEGTKEYKDTEKKIKTTYDKCISTARTNMFTEHAKDNEDYRLNVFCKNELLIDKTISEATGNFLSSWKNVTKEIYKTLDERKTEKDIFKEENEKLDKIANLTVKSNLKIVEDNKDEMHIKISDGFNKEKWIEDNYHQTVFYMHGALHLFELKDKTIKICKKDAEKKMIETIRDNWTNGYNSLTVLESSPDDKLKKISESEYLTYCLDHFKNIEGNLITHGVSFMQSDQHIIDCINNNDKLENIYIGYYNDLSEDIIKAFDGNDKVKYFDTSKIF